MPRYNERAVAGAAFVRWNRFTVNYAGGTQAALTFNEETVVDLADGDPIRREQPMPLISELDSFGSFPLLDLLTGAPLGASMTHYELLQAINSLYVQKALARDSA